MSSAAEAEVGALFINAREAVYLRTILEAIVHPQPRTPIQTDNSTGEGVINSTMQPKKSKAWDLCFWWHKCRESQQQFRIFWRPGTYNLGNYWTKHHAAAHHQNIRREILTPMIKVSALRKNKTRSEHSARVC